jgi:FxsC-like protein
MRSVFLSAAAGDDDPYVAEFFQDLRRELARISPAPAGKDYLSVASNRGAAWPAEMALRLATADVFVALCSPRYFLNETCGRQWSAFRDRLTAAGDRPSALIAVAWSADDREIPPFVELMTPEHEGTERGLRQLVRLRSLRASYREFVGALAQRIVAAAAAPPAEPVFDPAGLPDAFAASTPDSKVHFVVAAGSRDEMETVRDALAYYGPAAQDWAPYLPLASEPLALRARSLAADHALSADVGTVDDLLERLERARRANDIVVVLVDWWTTQIDAYQKVLAEIDRRGLSGTAVLVPANRADAETMDNRDELRYGFRTTFRSSVDQPNALLRSEIPTPDAFDTDLAGVIEEARNRLFRVGRVTESLGDEAPVSRPILQGP